MPVTFEECGNSVKSLIAKVIGKYHGDLMEAELTVDSVFARSDDPDKPAVKHHGYPAAAVIRKTSLKQRVLGHADAEITIDEKAWLQMTDEGRTALIDHELQHLEIQRDETGAIVRDDIGRPKLKMRLHDWELGGFEVIVNRHGDHAVEKQAAQQFADRYGQMLFGFAADAKPTKKGKAA